MNQRTHLSTRSRVFYDCGPTVPHRARRAPPAGHSLLPPNKGIIIIVTEFSFSFVGSVQGLFVLSLCFPPVFYVEGTSLTTSFRYQDSRLEIS